MMSRPRIIIFVGALVIVALFLLAIIAFPATHSRPENGGFVSDGFSSPETSSVGTASSYGNSAFAPQTAGYSPSGPSSEVAGNRLSANSSAVSASPSFQGKPVTTLGGVAQVVASATVAPTTSKASAAVSLLTLPNIQDSQVTIDPTGVATAMDFLSYFNLHYRDLSFDGQRFDDVLKDKNGIVLFPSELVDKAIADSDFKEISGSMLVQRDFATAEISFLESIKVTGQAVAVDKETIGMEELTVQLADDAMSVASGTFPENDFLNFYARFNATAENVREGFLGQSGVLSLAYPQSPSIVSRFLIVSGISTPAMAQTAATPFGGTILFLQPCPCDLGVNVTIGPPVPASVFVPFAFLATPLFFSDKALGVGVWWLGLDNELTQIPCAQFPACEPTDLGGTIIMVGTSPPLP